MFYLVSTAQAPPKEGDAVLRGGRRIGAVRFGDFLDAGDGVRPGAELGGKRDPVASVQRMDVPKVAVCTAIMSCHTDVARPNAGVGEVPRAFGEGGAVRALIDLDVDAQRGDFQRGKVAT